MTLYPVELLLVWQLPLELQLEEYCSAWRKAPLSGIRPSPGERYKSNNNSPTSLHVTMPVSTSHLQLFCSFCSTFTLHLFLSLSEGDKFGYLKLGSPGLVDFGIFGKVKSFTIRVYKDVAK